MKRKQAEFKLTEEKMVRILSEEELQIIIGGSLGTIIHPIKSAVVKGGGSGGGVIHVSPFSGCDFGGPCHP